MPRTHDLRAAGFEPSIAVMRATQHNRRSAPGARCCESGGRPGSDRDVQRQTLVVGAVSARRLCTLATPRRILVALHRRRAWAYRGRAKHADISRESRGKSSYRVWLHAASF